MQQVLQERYRLLKPIGSGGGGKVWLCEDVRLPGAVWAIKQMAMPQGHESERFRKNFKREAEVLARLRHPDLPLVVDSFEEGDACYLVMEYLKGEDLARYVARRGAMSERMAFECGKVLLDILAFLHHQEPRVVFRDLKPHNVVRMWDGKLKLVDFGLCRPFVPGERVDTQPAGSLGYAAPEQWEANAALDGRTDIYSWGATLMFLMTAQRPAATGPQPCPKVLASVMSEEGAAILDRCLRPEPGERYARVEELAAEVEHHLAQLAPTPPPAGIVPRPRSLVYTAAAALLALLVVTGLLAYWGRPRAATGQERASRATPQASPRHDRDQARSLYVAGRYREALALFGRVLAQYPDDGEISVLKQNAEILAQGRPAVHLPFVGSWSGSDEIDAIPQLHGVVVAQDLINRDGGINGRPLVVDLHDDTSSIPRCLEIAQKLVKNPEVMCVVGPYNSQRGVAVAPLFNEGRVNLVIPLASSEAIWEAGPYVFSATEPFYNRTRGLARYVVNRKFKRVALLTDRNSRISGEMSRFFAAEVEKLRALAGEGPEIIALPPFAGDDPDFSGSIRALTEAQPDLIFLCDTHVVTLVALCHQIRAHGIATPLCSQTVTLTRDLVEKGGADVEGLLLATYYFPDEDSPQARTFLKAFQARFGTLLPTPMAARTYDTFMAVANVMRVCHDREGVRERLRAIGTTKPPFRGATGPLTLGRRPVAGPVWIVQVQKGQFCLLRDALPPPR